MYALAINGSPRKKGNTELILHAVLEPLTAAGWETEQVQVGGKTIRGCQACGTCWKNKDNQCTFKDDIFNEIMAKMIRADAIILGSPTYFADVTAEMKALIDRSGFVAMGNGRAFAGKIGASVVAVRRGGAVHVFDTMNHLFFISQMIVPGSTYWNMVHGLDKGDAANDPEGMTNMKQLGSAIAWLGKAIAPHKDSYPVAR